MQERPSRSGEIGLLLGLAVHLPPTVLFVALMQRSPGNRGYASQSGTGVAVGGESLFQRLDAEEGTVREALDHLRSEVACLEERLAHLAITRRTVQTLLADPTDTSRLQKHPVTEQLPATEADEGPAEDGEGCASSPSRKPATPKSDRVPPQRRQRLHDRRELGPVSLRIVTLVSSADRPLRPKEVAIALGRTNPKRTQVEGIRAALKRLADGGHLRKVGPGLFTGPSDETEEAA